MTSSGRHRGWRTLAVVLVLVVLAGTAGVLAQPRTSGGALDPRSAHPEGARALAQILGRQGVLVQRVDRVHAAVDAASSGTTLLVVDSDVLGPDRLAELAGTGADLVLVEPDAPVLAVLAPALAPAGTAEPDVRRAECADADARAAGSALAGGRLVRAVDEAAAGGTALCFPDARDPDAASYAVTSSSGRQVTVVGQGDVLSNEHLASDGNAALALRTLGAHRDLVWLMASPIDASGDAEVSPVDLLPRWVPWVALQLGVVAVLAILWRARRLGRLVPEPLPVVVRSAETAEGRASLYRVARARDRSAAVLRAATLRRLRVRLGLPATASGEQVVEAAARAAARPGDDVRRLLLGPPPPDDAALVVLADDLDALMPHPRKAPVP